MAKKTFKDSPALQFMSTAEEEQEVTPEQKVPTTAKAPEGYKLNPLYVETKTKRLQLVLQPSLFNRVKKGAKQAGLSVNEYVHRILDEATKGEE
jgi:predicted DNA binding CopG/RHH family protein